MHPFANKKVVYFILPVFILCCLSFGRKQGQGKFISYTADPKTQEIRFFLKNDSSKMLRSIAKLKQYAELKGNTLLFAMNGGMYMEDGTPLGLYIENGKKIRPLNKFNAEGNFYLKPNGVFYLSSDKKAVVCETDKFTEKEKIKYATQSGPMLVIDGAIHPAFKEGSANLNIRNGVGILPDGKILLAISKEPVNFYDFAKYFLETGCRNALYLDGFVSRMYLPEKNWMQTDGNFGVMIGVTK